MPATRQLCTTPLTKPPGKKKTSMHLFWYTLNKISSPNTVYELQLSI